MHVDVALKGSTVRDKDPRGFDVTDEAAASLDVDLVRRADVTFNAAGDLDRVRVDVRLNVSVLRDGHGALDAHRAAHDAFNHQRIVTADVALDGDVGADNRVSF